MRRFGRRDEFCAGLFAAILCVVAAAAVPVGSAADDVGADGPATKTLPPVRVRADEVGEGASSLGRPFTRTRREIRDAVGAAWDVQRAFGSNPGVASSSDWTNSLVVRGGNPSENLILVDHIEIPSVSHLSWQGQTGGAMTMLAPDRIRDATFYTGAFPATFGGKLSSVLDVRLREGDRRRTRGRFDLSVSGVGGSADGPMLRRGAWFLSYRKSLLELLTERARLVAVPRYEDGVAKFVYDLSPAQRLNLLVLAGRSGLGVASGADMEDSRFDGAKLAVGATWSATIGAATRSRVTLSRVANRYDVAVRDARSAESRYRNASEEDETTLDAALDVGTDGRNVWNVGGRIRQVRFRHLIQSQAWRGFSENEGRIVWLGEQEIDVSRTAWRVAAFAQRRIALGPSAHMRMGFRVQQFSLTGVASVDPRFGIEWQPTKRAMLRLAAGRYHQSPTYVQLTLHPANVRLRDASATHLVAGAELRLTGSSRALVEAYWKAYRSIPILREEGKTAPSGEMVNGGRKRVRGVDVLVEKRSDHGPFGAIALTFSVARSRSSTGPWYPDDFDYRRLASITGGVPLGKDWTINGRWRFAGGRPFTAFPVRRRANGTYEAVPNLSARNAVRYPDYHRLDLRLNRTIQLGTGSAALYFEIDNAYARDNVSSWRFDSRTGTFEPVRQLGRLVVVGFTTER